MPKSTELQDFSWISLGGNMGNVFETFASARSAIEEIAIGSLLLSRIYESEPWGFDEQPSFLNQIVGFQTARSAEDTLAYCLEVERTAGRKRVEKWGPRPLDIDLLSWPGVVCQSEKLILPHPALSNRRFVLVPWAEVAGNFVPFGHTLSVKMLLDACLDSSWVRLAGASQASKAHHGSKNM